jgi:hypothetical protein
MIRQDFQDGPPMPFLRQIMNPPSKVYVFLWEKKDKKNRFYMTWKEITQYFNKNTFKTNLRKLTDEGLVSSKQNDDGVLVELVGWDDIKD